jgi:hypothetical protein
MNSFSMSDIRSLEFKANYPIVEYPGPDFLKDTSKIRNLIFAILAVTIIALGCLKGTMIS